MIALSGVDCAGKSTQGGLLIRLLRSRGQTPIVLWTRPGYTPGLEALKRAVKTLTGRGKSRRGKKSEEPSRYPRRAANLGHPLKRRLWLTTALLELLWLYAVRIRIWKGRGRTVVCDRYLLDCLVDFRVNFPADRVEEHLLCRLLRRFHVRPDAAFCLLVPASLSMERSRDKGRFHWETPEILQERHRAYRTLCRELDVQVLEGNRPEREVAASLQRGLTGILPGIELAPQPVPLEASRVGDVELARPLDPRGSARP